MDDEVECIRFTKAEFKAQNLRIGFMYIRGKLKPL